MAPSHRPRHRSGLAARLKVVHPVNTMDRPVLVTIDADERRRARRRAAEQGLTLSAYIGQLIRSDLEAWTPGATAPTGIRADADDRPPDHEGMYIGEAVAARMNKTEPPP